MKFLPKMKQWSFAKVAKIPIKSGNFPKYLKVCIYLEKEQKNWTQASWLTKGWYSH